MTTQHDTTLIDIETTNLLSPHHHHSLIVIRSDQRCIWLDDNTCVMKACAEWILALPIGQPPLGASSSFSHHCQIRDASDEMTTQHNKTLIDIDTSNLLSAHHHSHQSLCNEPTNQQKDYSLIISPATIDFNTVNTNSARGGWISWSIPRDRINDSRMSVLHQNEGGMGKSSPSRFPSTLNIYLNLHPWEILGIRGGFSNTSLVLCMIFCYSHAQP